MASTDPQIPEVALNFILILILFRCTINKPEKTEEKKKTTVTEKPGAHSYQANEINNFSLLFASFGMMSSRYL